MTVFTLLVCSLAAWRVAHMFTLEAGPLDVFTRLRARTTFGGVLDEGQAKRLYEWKEARE